MAGDQVPISDAQIRRQLLRHVLGCADGLVLPRASNAVVREQALEDSLSLGARVADHDYADTRRPLDLVRVPSHFLAVAKQDLLLGLDCLEAVAEVVGVAVSGNQPESDLLPAAPD